MSQNLSSAFSQNPKDGAERDRNEMCEIEVSLCPYIQDRRVQSVF